jgi:hypothetical protein
MPRTGLDQCPKLTGVYQLQWRRLSSVKDGNDADMASRRSLAKMVRSPIFRVVSRPITLVPWLFTEMSALRLVFATLGPLCGGSAAAIIYWILDRHKKTGDYLIVDLVHRTLTLPRQH